MPSLPCGAVHESGRSDPMPRKGDREELDQEEFTTMVSRLAGGMLVVFLGLCSNALFRFLNRMILARGLSESDYGAFTLGMVILEFATLLGVAGLGVGAARFISHYRGRGRGGMIKGTVRASLGISSTNALLLALLLLALSGVLADLFHDAALAGVIRVLAFALPFSVAVDLLTGVFRGFDLVRVKAVFEDFMLYGSCTLGVLVATGARLGLKWTAAFYAAAYALTGAALAFYAYRKLPALLGGAKPEPAGRKLLAFSFPLALESLLNMLVFWTDSLMLGAMKGTDLVGIYNAAVPFANLLPIFLLSVIYIFLPVVTRALAEGKREEVRKLYRSATKWAFTLTIPLFLVFFLFPERVVVFFAGSRYEQAGGVLVILTLGLFTHVFAGPNGMTLVALGRPGLVLADGAATALTNVVLNYLLIPHLGMRGAALASACSIALGNLLRSLQIYMIAGIHPFSSLYLKPALIAALGGVVTYPLAAWLVGAGNWLVVPLYPLYLALVLALLLLSGCLEEEDVVLVRILFARLRIPAGERVAGFLRRFLASR